ncbi:MAG: hypothetical protein R3F37_10805 [Candidatus Competibacteraceae bacterium]
MKKSLTLFSIFVVLAVLTFPGWAAIPATPVMTLYKFNGDLDIPYYSVESFVRSGASSPAGSLAQGTSVIPCLVLSNGRPLTDSNGTPYVGFQIVVDSRRGGPKLYETFKRAVQQRKAMMVNNHHCEPGIEHVLNVRDLYALQKAPSFDPPATGQRAATQARGELDQIVRTFHNSSYCTNANQRLIGRRGALERAWEQFVGAQRNRWSGQALNNAKHLDYTMRTTIFEAHLDRGCNAYAACERNIIALSIRNRGRESCASRQGCRFNGDFQGVSSKVSQYNIWDEFLTQISGLTSCFLRDDLGGSNPSADYYNKLQTIYAQNLADVQRILFGSDQDLRALFPNNSLADVKNLRHYYHAPAMGKCFPNHERVEYMSGAVARRGNDFALIANTRIRVDQRTEGGYFFRDFDFQEEPDRDVVQIVDRYPGFVVDGRKVSLKAASGCYPYGIPRGCGFQRIGRYRKVPFWLNAGKSLELTCRVTDQGENCQGSGTLITARVGGICDAEMRPVAGVK